MPPAHILNAPTKLMKDLGYGKGYAYDHDAEEGFSGQNYFPDGMEREQFYQPGERGFEREIGKRLEYWEKLRGEALIRHRPYVRRMMLVIASPRLAAGSSVIAELRQPT